MAIKTDCPRCKTPLLVPNKLAGGYAHCAECKGRFWVAKDAAADATPINAVRVLPADGAAVAAAAPQQSVASSIGVPLRGVPGAAVPPAPPAAADASPPPALSKPPARRLKKASASVPAPPAPPPPPVRQKKVARLISAEASDSTLRLAADGKLPELRLEEGAGGAKPEQESKSLNPLLMLGVLSMSVVLSMVLVLLDVGSSSDASSQRKDAMRRTIERDYFGSGSAESKDPEPYQKLLRDAQRAYTRGDRKRERDDYRKVLEMLRAERGSYEKGLTGSRTSDKRLEDAISVLLSGG